MVKKIKLAKGSDKSDGWKIDYEQLEDVQLECIKLEKLIGLVEIETIILSLFYLGYLNAENEDPEARKQVRGKDSIALLKNTVRKTT